MNWMWCEKASAWLLQSNYCLFQ